MKSRGVKIALIIILSIIIIVLINFMVYAIVNKDLKTSSGKIVVEKVEKLEAESSSGEIDIKSIENYFKLIAKSGSIEIDSLNISENSSITTKSGNVHINSKNDIYIETETISGDDNIKNNNRKADIEVKIATTSGSIYVE